ncbi:MAG: DUF1801 domain-containing protein [Candidatus Saccharimonadales bacterium]|nr:DUF1801 domain-containing protein [Candidatus Saccharimonadales bacterium]
MTDLKTKPNDSSTREFLMAVKDKVQRNDALKLLDLFNKSTGQTPMMWGSSIVGFGSYRYRYNSGREADWLATGFSPRKQSLTLYIMNGFEDYDSLLARLGPHKTGKSCLYIKRLSDIDLAVLEQLIISSYDYVKREYSKDKQA